MLWQKFLELTTGCFDDLNAPKILDVMQNREMEYPWPVVGVSHGLISSHRKKVILGFLFGHHSKLFLSFLIFAGR